MDTYFYTTHYELAAFLKMSNFDLREIRFAKEEGNQCEFVFRVDKDDPELLGLLNEWDTTKRCAEFRNIIFASKLLGKGIKQFLSNNKR